MRKLLKQKIRQRKWWCHLRKQEKYRMQRKNGRRKKIAYVLCGILAVVLFSGCQSTAADGTDEKVLLPFGVITILFCFLYLFMLIIRLIY